MDGSYLDPRSSGPIEEPTIQLNSSLSTSFHPSFPSSALTKDKPFVFSSTSTPDYDFSMRRLAKFKSASPLIKELLLVLYGTEDNFISATGHALEPFIFALDENLDSDSTVRAIGSAMGLFVDIDPNFFAYELLLDKLISCINVLETKRINDVKYADRPKIKDIIAMTRKEFKPWAEKYNIPFERLYQDRLNFFRFISLTDEERYEEENYLPEVYDTARIPNEQPLSSSIMQRVYYTQGI
jgi:hypothetical protein